MEQIVNDVINKTGEVFELGDKVEVSLLFVDDDYIQGLNAQYRGIDRATDVLSFAFNEGEEPDIIGGPEESLLGDIIISLDTAGRQANEYGHSLEREVAYLTVHGMLHLLGYDHEEAQDKQKMREREEYILALLGITREED